MKEIKESQHLIPGVHQEDTWVVGEMIQEAKVNHL